MILAMITRNSAERLGRMFWDVLLHSVQVPYHALILVDDSDSPKTREVVEKFADMQDKELVVERSRLYGYHRPTRATARQTAIDVFFEQFNDEWLFFLDDDCVLNLGWWEHAVVTGLTADPKVGLIWGINWDATDDRRRFLEALGIDYRQYLINAFKRRGGCHDTMLRRKAIEGIRIPPELHVYEDAWIYYYVLCGGWTAAVNPIGVKHYHPTSPIEDWRSEKERLKLAISVALKYGIDEHSIAKKSFRSYLGLVRPILGLAPMLPVAIKAYGLRRGLKEAVARQYLKLWFRWIVLRHAERLRKVPTPCEAVLGTL